MRLERVAWLTARRPITVAGPRPIFTALPHFSSLQIINSVYGPPGGVSMKGPFILVSQRLSTIFPVGLTLFHQRAQSFLRIFQAI
jgi:hypothetical protein